LIKLAGDPSPREKSLDEQRRHREDGEAALVELGHGEQMIRTERIGPSGA
jgi:hypothetical protein